MVIRVAVQWHDDKEPLLQSRLRDLDLFRVRGKIGRVSQVINEGSLLQLEVQLLDAVPML